MNEPHLASFSLQHEPSVGKMVAIVKLQEVCIVHAVYANKC